MSVAVTVTPAERLHGATRREKENGGALDIPGGNKLIELEYAQVEDRKLRGQLRNVSRLELLVRPASPLPPAASAASGLSARCWQINMLPSRVHELARRRTDTSCTLPVLVHRF